MTDISSYMELIQYEGARRPTREVLHELHVRHTRTIPFENLSPFTGMAVELDIDSLLDKFIRQRRGGYCYEHNSVFKHVLQNIGFEVQGLAARVRMNVPDHIATPRSHMLLLVKAEGETFIADTGFGSLTLTAPIRLVSDVIQHTPHGPYRLLSEGNGFRLQACVRREWQDLYAFELIPHYQEDYEVFNWYTSTHPASPFVNHLIAARPVETGRHVLHDRQYSFYRLDGRIERRHLESVGDVKELLGNEFRIGTLEIPGLDSRLSAIFAV